MERVSTAFLGTAQHKANPYPFYARLRRESPVAKTRLLAHPTWLVLRYDDALAALKDERLVKDYRSSLSVFNRFAGPNARHMLNRDAPDHTRLRTLVQKAFTARMIERLRNRIQEICDNLLDHAERDGRLDVLSGYALPIPLTVIGELLGVPDEDRTRFHRLSRASLAAASSLEAIRGIPNLWMISRHLRSLIARRRSSPGDDLLSALIQIEEAGDRLSEDELVGMVFLLVLAGYETTVNLIASGVLALMQHPAQLDLLRKDPTLIRTAVEELLRFTSPVDLASQRFATEKIEIAGANIPRGGMVIVMLGSANHDEDQFPDPDVVDIARDPNRHLAFGQGAHFCLGAPLARLEGEIAIGTLLRRFPDLSLEVPHETLRWRKSLIVRGLEALPVTLARRQSATA